MKTSKTDEIDMSSEALAKRLEQVRALYKLMVYLRQARGADQPASDVGSRSR